VKGRPASTERQRSILPPPDRQAEAFIMACAVLQLGI
jgi:hypothetical protein